MEIILKLTFNWEIVTALLEYSCFDYCFQILFVNFTVWMLFWILKLLSAEAPTRGVLWKKVFLEISQNSQENTCARVFFDKVAGLRLWEALAQVFSCEICKISKNTIFTEYLLTTVSVSALNISVYITHPEIVRQSRLKWETESN